MNKTQIEWVKNPDGTPGYTWNPITGCLNHVNGMCKGGNFPCYAYRLAHGRLKERYLANPNFSTVKPDNYDYIEGLTGYPTHDPSYPRFWPERLEEPMVKAVTRGRTTIINVGKEKGIFVSDMGDLFGIGIPEEWTRKVMQVIEDCPNHRFYLLTKQPQNLVKFSPFPDNVYLGVTVCNQEMLDTALLHLIGVDAKVKYISFEPLLGEIYVSFNEKGTSFRNGEIQWLIIGAQSKPTVYPRIEWVREIVEAADKAGIPMFLKDNLGWPRLSCEGGTPFYKKHPSGTMELRQEMPKQ